MNAEFFDAIAELEKEKGIPKAYMLEKINLALVTAIKKDSPSAAENLIVEIDEKKKQINIHIQKTVVDEVLDPGVEILLDEARKISKKAELGDLILTPVHAKKFGRIAAQAAKQVIIQGIREAERGMVYEEFTSKEHEIFSGIVSYIDPLRGNVSIKITSNAEYTDAVLLAGEQVKSESLQEGEHIKVYLVEVRRSTRGPQILISRTHPGLVKRLFELEVPEISEGLVEIRSIAREAGSRTKLAVFSKDAEIDPIGACIGPKGGRVSGIVKELRGEKIDIIQYNEDPAKYVAAALSPAEAVSVSLSPEGKSCKVVVPDSQLSLAIGKEGQNARLAAKLTGFKIDIRPLSQEDTSAAEALENTELLDTADTSDATPNAEYTAE